MQALNDIINPTPEEAIKLIEKKPIFSPQWEEAKRKLHELSDSFTDVLIKRYRSHPHKVRKHKESAGTVIEAMLEPINGYEVQLVIREHSELGVSGVNYYVFDNRGCNCYIRVLLPL